jgi:putative ABC transport system permease protein
METLLQDIRYGLRMLAKDPGFTFVAMLTLALGIGTNTAIFSLTDQILLRLLPVVKPEELVVLRSPGPNPGHTWSDSNVEGTTFSYPMYKDLRAQNSVFAGLIALYPTKLSVVGLGDPQRAQGELVSGNYFQILGVAPALGRVFSADDETSPGANPVAVLNFGYWTRQFGRNPAILNQQLNVNGTSLTVVGVARSGFTGVQIGQSPDLFIPITMKAQMTPNWDGLSDRADHWVAILGRLNPGFSRERADAALAPAYKAILQAESEVIKISPKTKEKYLARRIFLDPGANGREILQQDAQTPLVSLMGMVGMVLLIACANLAGLLVARGESRQHEIAVRLALGAGRGRVIRQLLTESLLLALAGGIAGVALASWLLGTLVANIPGSVGAVGLNNRLDYRVLGFAAGLSIVTGVLFGLVPSLRAARSSLQSTLKDQGSNLSEGKSGVKLRRWLMVSQMALTAVLLAAAGLFLHSMLKLKQQDLGLRTDHVMEFSVAPEDSRYSVPQTIALFDRMRENIHALSGVQSVSAAEIPLFADDTWNTDITLEGYTFQPDEDAHVSENVVGPNYFSTMGTPLLSGREFTENDRAGSPKVVIINESLARRYFAGRNPVGLHLALGTGSHAGPPIEIVGVVRDSKHTDTRGEIRPFMYFPYAQDQKLGRITFYLRTAQDPSSMAGTLRSVVRSVDATIPVFDVKSLNEQVDENEYSDRLLTVFSLCLGLLASLLAALGLYGMMAYVVARRTREIGLRMALGASQKGITWMILSDVVRTSAAGLAIGLVGGIILGRLIESELFGVKAGDPSVFAASTILLAGVALLAGWLPARNAARVDPMVALRHE